MQESGQQTLSAPLQDTVSTYVPTNITRMVSRLFYGAADQIRTGDLILTKDALYRLSYSSEFGDPERARTVDL